MSMKKSFRSYLAKGGIVVALAGVMTVGMAGAAFASDPYWSAPNSVANTDGLVTSYGVRAGSAGPDFMGISGTNFDFSGGSSSSNVQYEGYTADALNNSTDGAGLAIWASSVNENPNPYYTNLYYNAVNDTSYAQATTWMSNPDNSSWGDSNGSESHIGNNPNAGETIAGLEYSPNIIFGDAKYLGWANFDQDKTSGTNIREYLAKSQQYIPNAYVNNDATNIWTQVYSMKALANAADGIATSTTRYNNGDATISADDYENAIRGNMLYIASQIDDQTNNINKKTVAYLYAIDASGTAYFFTPQADEMLEGCDTGTQGPVGDDLYGDHKETTADNCTAGYASNNGTINLGYMGVLPFITNTFDNNNPVVNEETNQEGIVMKVEDIYKANPACKVVAGTDEALADVDVIIYNTTTATNLDGTSGGKNSSGVNNDYYSATEDNVSILTDERVTEWAKAHGFDSENGLVVAGDDFGTSTNQGYGDKVATEGGMAPLLYCQRNYTADKNARAAWAFSQVYPELYNSANDSYCYWVNNIYHVRIGDVPKVAAYMTNQSGTVTYNALTATAMENHFEAGYKWWNQTGQYDSTWSKYSYYNGSSRASYYSDASSEEPENIIGIFASSTLLDPQQP